MQPSFAPHGQAEQYLEQRYKSSLFQLKVALGLSHVPVTIPPHILVCKAVALLRYQFSQIQKEDIKQTKASPWDHPKYQSIATPGVNTANDSANGSVPISDREVITKSVSSSESKSKGSNQIAFHHDTRQFYANSRRHGGGTGGVSAHSHSAKSVSNSMVISDGNGNVDQFCPTIGGGAAAMGRAAAMDTSVPPIDWGSDSGLDTIEIDHKLKTETEQKLGIKSENGSTMDTTNEFTAEWDDFAVFDEDIDFDVPLQMQFDSEFL